MEYFNWLRHSNIHWESNRIFRSVIKWNHERQLRKKRIFKIDLTFSSRFFFMQVPYETLNKRYRHAQKQIDRDAAQLLASVAELDRSTLSASTIESLKRVLERAMNLKRKVCLKEKKWIKFDVWKTITRKLFLLGFHSSFILTGSRVARRWSRMFASS